MNPITQPLITYVCSACRSAWRAVDDAERCCKCQDCGELARKNWSTCDACGRIKSAQRDASILERRLATAISINDVATMEVGEAWWRHEDDAECSLTELLELICEREWDSETGIPENTLPDVVEFVVGTRLTFCVQDELDNLFCDYEQGVDFNLDAVKFAQEAVDLAAETASVWGDGETYWVDIRELHATAIHDFLADGVAL